MQIEREEDLVAVLEELGQPAGDKVRELIVLVSRRFLGPPLSFNPANWRSRAGIDERVVAR